MADIRIPRLQSYKFRLEMRSNFDDALTDVDSVTVDILDPDDVVIVNDAATVQSATGVYTYTHTPAAGATIADGWTIRWAPVYLGQPLSTVDEQFEVLAVTDAFATLSEFEAHLGQTVPDDKVAQALQVLANATAAIRGRTGQTISRVIGDVATLDPRGACVLFLPQKPVEVVSAVTVDGTALVVADDVHWYSDGRLAREPEASWGTKRQSVAVTYTHGFDPVPQRIKEICLAHAAREYENPVAVSDESLGPLARTFAHPSGFTPDELETLDSLEYTTAGIA